MSATSFQRMRRIQALKEALDEKGIDYSEFAGDEAALREALEAPEHELTDEEQAAMQEFEELKAKAVELEIDGYEEMDRETLKNTINDELVLIQAELDKQKQPDEVTILGDNGQPEVIVPLDEAALRAKAKELGIKSWHIKSVDTLTEEIAEKEKGGE